MTQRDGFFANVMFHRSILETNIGNRFGPQLDPVRGRARNKNSEVAIFEEDDQLSVFF